MKKILLFLVMLTSFSMSMNAQEVFNSILQHILHHGNPCFTTRDPLLSDYLLRNKVFSKQRTDQISFSYPQQFQLPTDPVSQGGDGDCFV